jgi:hypothetical protein
LAEVEARIRGKKSRTKNQEVRNQEKEVPALLLYYIPDISILTLGS